jgi:uncharacterized protein YjbI with pentapeptide repeats
MRNLDRIGAILFQARLALQRRAFQLYMRARKPRLAGADLSYLSFQGLKLPQANLEGADLSYADLSRTDLREADLRRAALRFANLSAANLAGADLEGANLDGAALHGIDLSGALLVGARITPEQLDQAGSLCGAILPDGTMHA